jgi:hypothetical protein
VVGVFGDATEFVAKMLCSVPMADPWVPEPLEPAFTHD